MRIYLLVIALLVATSAHGQEKPPLPFYDWGACPFECCTYRSWETVKEVDTHTTRSEHGPIAFHLGTHQKVLGVTGVVVTLEYGVTRVVKPAKVGYNKDGNGPKLSLKPGETLYTLHYMGEGAELFWYHGKTYSDEISSELNASGSLSSDSALSNESSPKTEWWVKVKNNDGVTGWTNDTDSFTHMDRCE